MIPLFCLELVGVKKRAYYLLGYFDFRCEDEPPPKMTFT